ncbi:hypothetical protein WKW80_34910 [Variovorax humicola]|uniref:Uncharacterized protein n=1 Tax=Variovorax humicola TaxID=1769758 RepID=A0ABU8WB21_9BURK
MDIMVSALASGLKMGSLAGYAETARQEIEAGLAADPRRVYIVTYECTDFDCQNRWEATWPASRIPCPVCGAGGIWFHQHYEIGGAIPESPAPTSFGEVSHSQDGGLSHRHSRMHGGGDDGPSFDH